MRTIKITATDGYKFSMAEAGAPLRHEVFHYTHRKGGWQYMPVDAETFVKGILPTPAKEDYDYLSEHNYEVGAAYRKAFSDTTNIEVKGIPKGSWFNEREPLFSVEGASAVSSWLEPAALQLHLRIQVATAYFKKQLPADLSVTCQEEKDLILETLDNIEAKIRPNITVCSEEYYTDVFLRAKDLVDLVKDPDRIFEVGMRAVSCSEQHEIALRAIKDAGILRTSNVEMAQKLGMIPVGTMGHEHVQRYGDDYEAYIAMRDRFPGFLFYLPDTYSTIQSGVPSALRVIAERPDRDAGIRFDSEKHILGHYMFTVAKAMEMKLQPRLALESGWNRELTIQFEQLRETVRWPADRQAYGYGGYLVKPKWKTFLRDDVAAVWKVSQTGSMATMKFGDEPGGGKQSIPGRPVVWRPHAYMDAGVPSSVILQDGELWNPGFEILPVTCPGGVGRSAQPAQRGAVLYSPETLRLIEECKVRKAAAISRAALRDQS